MIAAFRPAYTAPRKRRGTTQGTQLTPELIASYQQLAREAIANCPAYPAERFHGRGIVTCAGGAKYFPCVWVTLNELRRLGCTLPVEVWHLGRHEMTPEMEGLLAPLGAKCVDASLVRQKHPARILNGWELKPYSIIHSAFEEVLFLDADSIPVKNPEYLFDAQEYHDAGAIFWPDYGRLAPTREIWTICNVPYRDEPEFESGQIFINKRRCWREINLTMHLNEHSDFYYRYIHGDKETFHMAWRMLETPYAMPPFPIHPLPGVMCQHDFSGERLFQHRNLCKFKLSEHKQVVGFGNEGYCYEHIAQLQSKWIGCAVPLHVPDTLQEADVFASICRQRHFVYERMGYDTRFIELLENHRIGEGGARLERAWDVIERNGRTWLRIIGETGVICELSPTADGWHGHWNQFERMPIRVRPRSVGVI